MASKAVDKSSPLQLGVGVKGAGGDHTYSQSSLAVGSKLKLDSKLIKGKICSEETSLVKQLIKSKSKEPKSCTQNIHIC